MNRVEDDKSGQGDPEEVDCRVCEIASGFEMKLLQYYDIEIDGCSILFIIASFLN